jgi:hypothetical protein
MVHDRWRRLLRETLTTPIAAERLISKVFSPTREVKGRETKAGKKYIF